MQPNPALTSHALNVPLNALAWSLDGTTLAIAGGNGTLYLFRPTMQAPLAVLVEAEAALLTLTATPTGFVTGTDSGSLHLITPQGEHTPLTTTSGGFNPITSTAYSPHTNAIIYTQGKNLLSCILTAPQPHLVFTSPGTLSATTMSPLGPRAAVSHYGGASIVDLKNPKNPPRRLEWKGSHTALTYSPNGKWLISAMQENALHLWRLSDGQDLQMRGYPGKIDTFSWSHDGLWLATNGGSGVPLWNFANPEKGPAGQQATVVADSGSPELLVTAVAMHPKGPFLAVGYADGLTLLTQYAENKAILIKAPESQNPAAINTLAWSPNGLHLALTTTQGTLHTTNFESLAHP